VRDQVSHPYSTTGKITVLYILIFSFFIWGGETKHFGLNDSNHSLTVASFSNDSLATPIFWFCPEFGWRVMIIDFVFSAFISRTTSAFLISSYLCVLHKRTHTRAHTHTHTHILAWSSKGDYISETGIVNIQNFFCHAANFSKCSFSHSPFNWRVVILTWNTFEVVVQ
jgi:hypothetical protein